jgi:hypothetical protein
MTQGLDLNRMIVSNATPYITRKQQWLMLMELQFIGRRLTSISSLFLHLMSPTKKIDIIIVDLIVGPTIKIPLK